MRANTNKDKSADLFIFDLAGRKEREEGEEKGERKR